jgi:predicted N-acetyltransferase YhbS
VTDAIRIRPGTAADAAVAADLAERTRGEYAAYSPVFWRPAPGGREAHEPFLARLLVGDTHRAFVAELNGEVVGVVLAHTRMAPPPFRRDGIPTWSVDDLHVRSSSLLGPVGAILVEHVVAAATAAEARRVVAVGAVRDRLRREMLERTGFAVAAHWWVKALGPDPPLAFRPFYTKAVVTAPPPVYAPGGRVTFVHGGLDAGEVSDLTAWATLQASVLAVVPASVGDEALRDELAANGYHAASEWYVLDVPTRGHATRSRSHMTPSA